MWLVAGCLLLTCATLCEGAQNSAKVIDVKTEESWGRKKDTPSKVSSRVKRDTPAPLTESEISSVLDKINTMRQSVDPTSSDMILVQWNDDLASYAEQASTVCDSSQVAVPEDFPFSAHLLISFTTTRGELSVEDALEIIVDYVESFKNRFDYETLACTSDESICRVYSRMIRDINYQFGASVNTCGDKYVIKFVYGDPGSLYDEDNNLISPYQEGEPCTECLPNFPFCDSTYSLCSETPSIGPLPSQIEIVNEPGPNLNPAKEPFETQPKVALRDSDGNLFTAFAYPSCPWYIAVSISGSTNPNGELFGHWEVPVIDGYATFTDLRISKPGDYQLTFFVSYPDDIDGSDIETQNVDISIGEPLGTFEDCDIEEGDKRFEKTYSWEESCASVCLGDCDDPDSEVCIDLDNCGPNAECVNDECACKHPNDYEKHPLDLDHLHDTLQPELYCMPDYMEIRFDKCGMNALYYKLGDLYMLGSGDAEDNIEQEKNLDKQLYTFIESCEYNDCRGRVVADSTGLKYSFMIQKSFLDCNGGITSNDTYITYHHSIQGMGGWSNGVISRRQPIALDFSCSYVRDLSSTMGFFASPFIRTVRLSIDSEGEFDLSFGLWFDSGYMLHITEPPMIQIPDPIYVGIFVPNTDVFLFAETCYATQEDDVDDTTRKDLITNGVPADDSVTVTENGESHDVKFYFESFAFASHPDDTTLYIHCKTIICAEEGAPCATPLRRRKRATEDESGSVSTTVTVGPVYTQPSDERRKRNVFQERYAASFSSEFSTQEIANPPLQRTTGVGQVWIGYS